MMPRPRSKPLASLAVLLALIVSAPALAQLGGLLGGDPDKVPEFSVRIGWPTRGEFVETLAPAERFVPIRVTINATDEAIDGLITLEYDQDGSQRSRLVAPFATTPGRETAVDLIASLPRGLSEIECSLRTADGSRQWLYVAGAMSEGERELPSIGLGAPVIALVGPRAETARSMPLFPPTDDTQSSRDPDYASEWRHYEEQEDIAQWEPAWRSVSTASVQPDELPNVWAAYDALAALVIDARIVNDIEPRSREAIITWVQGGGRLFILAPPGGDDASPITPETARACVRSLDPVRAPIDSTLRDRIRPFEEAASDDTDAAEPSSQTDTGPITQSVFALTAEGQRHGWRLRWTPEGLDADPRTGVGAIAEGPAGLGWVTLIGVDPARATATLDRVTADAAWREVVTPAVQLRLREGAGWNYQVRSGANPAEREGVQRAINRTGRATVDPAPIFVGVVIGVALLALLLGPIDFFVLKRLKLRHLSWLTASAYILAFTLIAGAMPVLIRGGDTEVNRAEVIDIIRLAPDDPANLAAERVDLAWRSGLTGLTSQRAQAIGLDAEALGPRTVWRGISSLATYNNQNANRLAAVTYAGRGPTQPLGPIPSPLWTFRALSDQGPVELGDESPLPDVDVVVLDDGECRLEIRNLRPDHRVSNTRVYLRDAYHATADDDPRTVTNTGRVDIVLSSEGKTIDERRAHAMLNNPPVPSTRNSPFTDQDEREIHQPGVLDRNHALAARLDTGRWALAMFRITSDAANITATQGAENTTGSLHQTYRVLVPLRPRDIASAATDTTADNPEDTDA